MQSPQSQTACSVTDLDGWFAGDVRDEEVHGDVLAVNVFVHHIPNSLGHHIGVQVRVVLREDKDKGKYVNDMLQHSQMWTYRVAVFIFWPYGRRQLLSGPWRAHRSSWSCRARTGGWRPTRDTSQENLRCDLWPHATLWATQRSPQNIPI